MFGKDDSILSLLHSYMAKKKKNNNAQNRLTADISCYSWLKMGKGPVILMVCCKTVPLKSFILAHPFQQGIEFSQINSICFPRIIVCRKPYLIFKNRIHISYIEDFAVTKPLDFQNLFEELIIFIV